jgi:hypothetical protein
MNFHQRHDLAGTGREIVRYEPVSPKDGRRRNDAAPRLIAMWTAPLLGAPWIFPKRFDRSFHRIQTGLETHDVIPEHAAWYYGGALHLQVDPEMLTHRISDWLRDHRGARWAGTSFLDSADWSAAISPITLSPIHREMHEMVAAGKDVRDTRAYANLMRAIKLGRPGKRNNVRLGTVEAVEAYLRYCRGLIKSMRKRGVVRHKESGPFHGLRIKYWNARSPMLDSTERDIGVAISEAGELIRHLGGKHRTAIAQALKLPVLPVEIRMVHAGWLARQVERTGLPPHQALVEGVKELAAASQPLRDFPEGS